MNTGSNLRRRMLHVLMSGRLLKHATGVRTIRHCELPLFHLSSNRMFASSARLFSKNDENITVTFLKADGQKIKAQGKVGNTFLDVVKNNNVDLEGFGACDGSQACSTCHLIFKEEDFNRIGDQATYEEEDLLDLAFGRTDTSRLGCQVYLTKELDGIEVTVPVTRVDARGGS